MVLRLMFSYMYTVYAYVRKIHETPVYCQLDAVMLIIII